MAQIAKFHKKAIAIYGCQQLSEGVSCNNISPTGTITTTNASPNVTGSGTLFTTQCVEGQYMYNAAGTAIIGRIKTITSNTAIVLEDNVTTSGVSQSPGVQAISVPVTAAAFRLGLGPKNAIAVLNLNFGIELTSESFQYVGDELDRDEATVITDRFAKFDFETFLPTRGTMAGTDPIESEIPLADWFQAAGFAVVLSTGSTGYYKITNGVASNAYLTVEIRKSSQDLTGGNTQKAYVIDNVRGSLDLSGSIGPKPKLKYNFTGNLSTIAMKMTLVPNFRNMKFDLTPALKSTTIGLSALDLYSGSTEPSPSGSSNFCFEKIDFPNISGFNYNRYLMSCLDGWSKGAETTDVTVTVLEDSTLATYDPYVNIENDHRLTLEYSDSAAAPTVGKRIQVVLHKVKLTNVSKGSVADYEGLDLKFRNVGYSDIKFY